MSKLAKIATFVAAALASVPAWACTVCFGETDSPMAHGAEMSILFMIIVTYFVIISGLVVFVALRAKARRAAADRSDPGFVNQGATAQ